MGCLCPKIQEIDCSDIKFNSTRGKRTKEQEIIFPNNALSELKPPRVYIYQLKPQSNPNHTIYQIIDQMIPDSNSRNKEEYLFNLGVQSTLNDTQEKIRKKSINSFISNFLDSSIPRKDINNSLELKPCL